MCGLDVWSGLQLPDRETRRVLRLQSVIMQKIESIPASKSVNSWVFPPWGVCLALQLMDGQQHCSLLKGICVGVRMAAHEQTVLFFFCKTQRYFFPLYVFTFECVHGCGWSDLCVAFAYVCVFVLLCHEGIILFFLFGFLSDRQTLRCHACTPDAGRKSQTTAWCKCVCSVCIIWLSSGLHLWRISACVWVCLSVCTDDWFLISWALYSMCVCMLYHAFAYLWFYLWDSLWHNYVGMHYTHLCTVWWHVCVKECVQRMWIRAGCVCLSLQAHGSCWTPPVAEPSLPQACCGSK